MDRYAYQLYDFIYTMRTHTYLFKTPATIGLLVLAASDALADGGLPSARTHQVGMGDTLASIAQRYTGDNAGEERIIEMNPHLLKTDLQIGDVLFVPDNDAPGREPRDEIELPPPPSIQPAHELIFIKGRKTGLAQISIQGKFAIVPAPVEEAQP